MKTRNLLLALVATLSLPVADACAQERDNLDGKLGYTAKSTEILEEYQTLRISEITGQHVYKLNAQSEPVVFSSEELYGGQLLEKLQSYKATRLTIKIDGGDLTPYKPLMEMLWKNGIKSHIANEEKDVDNTYMPDSRMVRVFAESQDKPYSLKYNDFSWSCKTLEEVLYWVPMLDAHGLCLYPSNDDFPYSIAQQIARSAWDSHIPQVSMVLPDGNRKYCTILPEDRDLNAAFPGYTVRQIEKQLLKEYESTASDIVTIDYPVVRVNMTGATIEKIERSSKELRIFTTLMQGPDLWISYDANNVIVADGKTYRCRQIIGMAGSEKDIFWSPDYCQYRLCHVYEPLDADVVEFDINPDGNSDQWYGIQASPDHNPIAGTVNATVTHSASILEKINTNDQIDLIILDRVEMNEKNTMLYFTLHISEERKVPISVNSDWEISLDKSKSYKLTRLYGIPADQDYIRDAGFTSNTFRAEFPAIKRKFRKGVVTGTTCGEKVRFEIRSAGSTNKLTIAVNGKPVHVIKASDLSSLSINLLNVEEAEEKYGKKTHDGVLEINMN